MQNTKEAKCRSSSFCHSGESRNPIPLRTAFGGREYENGTLETLRALPVGAGEFFLGKAIPYFFIRLVDVLVAILVGQLLFGVVMKASFWLMILASAVYILVALSIGLLISVRTQSQLVANQLAVLVTYLPSLLLSDFVFPQQNMPVVLKAVSRLMPAIYYIDILNGLYLRNLSFLQLWPSMSILRTLMSINDPPNRFA